MTPRGLPPNLHDSRLGRLFCWPKGPTMTEMNTPIDYVRSRKETAKILNISMRTLRRMELRREAPAKIQISDNRVGYRDSAIVTFLNSRPVA